MVDDVAGCRSFVRENADNSQRLGLKSRLKFMTASSIGSVKIQGVEGQGFEGSRSRLLTK